MRALVHLEEIIVMYLLVLLAVYHLAMGVVALLAPGLAARIVGALYGATLGDSPQLRYATSMIGALALTVGMMIVGALWVSEVKTWMIVAVTILQLARLLCRIRDRRLLERAFGITPRRNAAAAAVLGLEIVILSLALR